MAKKKPTKAQRAELTRIVEYFISGGAGFWSGYIIIVLLDNVMPLFVANLIGNGVGLTINFFLNRYWVFSGRRKASIETATMRYVVYTALNAFLLNYLILQGLRGVGIEPYIGQFIASGFFTVWNYFWYKTWVFKSGKPAHIRYHTH